eukprot:6511029-Alexandrium_andersonii.AAC.1
MLSQSSISHRVTVDAPMPSTAALSKTGSSAACPRWPKFLVKASLRPPCKERLRLVGAALRWRLACAGEEAADAAAPELKRSRSRAR